jgi:hypothetical protein
MYFVEDKIHNPINQLKVNFGASPAPAACGTSAEIQTYYRLQSTQWPYKCRSSAHVRKKGRPVDFDQCCRS